MDHYLDSYHCDFINNCEYWEERFLYVYLIALSFHHRAFECNAPIPISHSVKQNFQTLWKCKFL